MREELTRKRLCNIGDTYKTLQLDPKKKKKRNAAFAAFALGPYNLKL